MSLIEVGGESIVGRGSNEAMDSTRVVIRQDFLEEETVELF